MHVRFPQPILYISTVRAKFSCPDEIDSLAETVAHLMHPYECGAAAPAVEAKTLLTLTVQAAVELQSALSRYRSPHQSTASRNQAPTSNHTLPLKCPKCMSSPDISHLSAPEDMGHCNTLFKGPTFRVERSWQGRKRVVDKVKN